MLSMNSCGLIPKILLFDVSIIKKDIEKSAKGEWSFDFSENTGYYIKGKGVKGKDIIGISNKKEYDPILFALFSSYNNNLAKGACVSIHMIYADYIKFAQIRGCGKEKRIEEILDFLDRMTKYGLLTYIDEGSGALYVKFNMELVTKITYLSLKFNELVKISDYIKKINKIKLANFYLYIASRVHNNIGHENNYQTCAMNSDKIFDDLSMGSRATLDKYRELLDELDIIKSYNCGKIKIGEDYRECGYVYCLSQDKYKEILEKASEERRNFMYSIYSKGENK